MGLFTRHEPVDTAPVVHERTSTEPKRSSTLFGHRKGSSPSVSSSARTTSTTSSSPPRRHGLLHRNDGDPSIRAAHDRVLSAEAAERDADKALLHARAMVKDAREQVKRLEREAAEEARLAKIKQTQAANISKRARGMGRHDHV